MNLCFPKDGGKFLDLLSNSPKNASCLMTYLLVNSYLTREGVSSQTSDFRLNKMEYLFVVEGAGNLDTVANFIKTFILNQY
jgi:hypothetical protein